MTRSKRETETTDSQSFYNLTEDMFDIESDIKNPDTKVKDQENLEVEEETEDVGYFFDKTWEWDKLPSKLHSQSIMNN